jgi:signal transduction histidine kinase
VPPLSPEVWREVVDDDAARRRAALLSLLVLALTAFALAAAPRLLPRSPAAAWGTRAVAIVVARLALVATSTGTALRGSALVDPGVYAGGWPLELNDSPLALLLTCAAFAGVAACLDVAAARGRRTPLSAPLFGVLMLGALVLGRGVLSVLVAEVVDNSAVHFLPGDGVLPPLGAATLFVALIAAGAGMLALLDALWRRCAPDVLRTRRAQLASVAVMALVLAPVGDADAPHRAGLTAAGVLAFLAALGAAILGGGTATRAAVVPLGLALGLFAPLQNHLDAALRDDLAYVADERMAETEGGREEAELLFVERVLAGLAGNEELDAALGERRLPRDLAARLWADSALSQHKGASGLEVLPLESEFEYQSFSADMPPRTWLPNPKEFFGPGETWVVGRDGRGLGADSRWVVGETPVVRDDARPLSLRVWLEVRPPRTTRLLDMTEPGSSGSTGTRTPQRPALDRYDATGHVVASGTENPFTPLGSRLDAWILDEVLASGGPVWRTVSVAGSAFLVLVLPDDTANTEGGVLAFSTEAVGPGDLLLRGTKSALLGAVLAALAVILSAPWWAGGTRLRLAHRLVLSYVLVSAIPLLILAWANRELVQERDLGERRRELREAVTMLAAALHQPAVAGRLAAIDPSELERMGAGVTGLTDFAYSPGRRENVYLGARLVASTDQGLLDTDLLPTRMPGRAYHEVVLQGRAFHVETARAGGHSVDVGYAPLRNPESPRNEVIGAVSVAMVHEGALQDRDQASVVTAVLGFYLASLVAAMALGSWLATRLTSPLRELRLATRRVAAGDLSEPVPGEGPGELGQVVEAFNSMTRDLADSREKLVRAEKEAAWRDMARQVAHEVKNPLTPMRLAAEHLRRAHEDESPQFDSILKRSVAVIIRQTENLRRIVTDFRDFARMPVQRREAVDLAALLRQVLDLYGGVPGLTVAFDTDDDVPPVTADPDEMRRVLVNLAGNAVEALSGGEGTLTAGVRRDGDALVVTIADDGPGIPADVLPRLFEPSFSTKTGGTGLGLAICKRAIEDLGGTIDLTSQPGAGTTVTVRLPVTP